MNVVRDVASKLSVIAVDCRKLTTISVLLLASQTGGIGFRMKTVDVVVRVFPKPIQAVHSLRSLCEAPFAEGSTKLGMV